MTSSETFPVFGDNTAKTISPLSPTSPIVSHARTFSMSSDRPSMTGSGFGGMLAMPSVVSPEPNYIAPSAASQIVTNDHDSQSDTWFDQHGIEPSGETAMVAPSAMKLVNRFLDQLLFNFLSTAKSVSLASLRPAVIEVLKPKLAKGAIYGADQELNEYLGGGEDEELLSFHNGLEPTGQWDLELAWKRTRLRCMVYSSLGDMEEEDEDRYTEEGNLEAAASNRFSNSSGVVSPAVAIFLTSILEFMGEQALIVAGQAAYQRLRSRHEKDEQDGTNTVGDIADRIVVNDMDMERVALDRTLGRLWRGWKKRIRSPNQSVSMNRSFSRESLRSRIHSRRGSNGEPAIPTVDELPRKASLTESMIHENAASIALPMGDDDVRHIEIPGLAQHSDDEDEGDDSDSELPAAKPRPKSMLVSREPAVLPSAALAESNTPKFLGAVGRKRSHSVPTRNPAPFTAYKKQESSTKEAEEEDAVAATAPTGEEVGDDSVTLVEDHEEEKVAEPKTRNNKGVIAGVIAGVGAVGAAAVAGIAASAKGQTPQTTAAADSDVEEEEAEIMTSSRVSIGGRRSPDESTIRSRASSARPQSVHSLRVVDITHSPTRSRQGSVGSIEHKAARQPTLSRTNSLQSPARSPTDPSRTLSPIQKAAAVGPIVRSISSHQSIRSNGNIIDEVEERDITPEPRRVAAVAVPDRSPLRESTVQKPQKAEATPKDEIDPKPVMSANTPYFGEPQFNLAAAPKHRANRERELYAAQPSRSQEPTMVKTPDTGAPPLTPLREMMEVAQDTSDEASSVAPSVETSEGRPPASIPGNYRSYEGHPRSVPNGASPPRVKHSPVKTRREEETTPRQRSTSKPDRQLHTSSSSTSSGSHKVRPIRTSEDSHQNGSGKSFDELIQSDQTIQYTLTPQSMRQIEGPESPRESTTMSVNRRRSNSIKSGKSLSKATGLNSNPPHESRAAPPPPASTFKPVPVSRSANQANMGSRVRSNAPQARDARVERDSISDFADFIRSTGPPGVSLPSNANGHTGQNGAPRKTSVSRTAPVVAAMSPPRSSSSSATRRLQAREAIVPLGDHSSDLIDFIRQGPPSEKTHDNPRIPRTVAPFRTTMDSDQMSGAVGGRSPPAVGVRDSMASGSMTNENSMQSMHSSIHSQSGLLKSNNSTSASKQSQQNFDSFDEEDPMPKRKQRRVRDPYAIDFSDEEDDFDAAPVRKPQRQEESLIDFLNSVPPPPSTSSVFDEVPKPITKKSSTQGLMGRFSRSASIDAGNKLTKSDSHSRSQGSSSTRINGHAPQIPPPHIPISVTIQSSNNSYNGAPSRPSDRDNYTSRLDSERNPGNRPRVPQKGYQPRDAVNRPPRSGASELADFLMNTPPPPGNGMRQPNFGVIDEEEKSGSGSTFVRSMFGRRKKATS